VLSFRKMTPNWIKSAAHKIIWQYRMATCQNRMLPDFVIIGAQKSGTSSLFAYLSQHPRLLPSYRKEVHFFDGGLDPRFDYFQNGPAWYRAHFPLESQRVAQSQVFEASPLYIFNPLVPERMFDLLPNVKIIAVLRNPTERAISHYFHMIRTGDESLPIQEALMEEERRLESSITNKNYKSHAFIYQSYKSRGLYQQQLDRFLQFFPQQNILVLCSEDLFSNPELTLRRVFEFVEVDPGFKVKDLTPSNVASNRSKIAPSVYEYLDRYFQPHNEALYEFLGYRLNW